MFNAIIGSLYKVLHGLDYGNPSTPVGDRTGGHENREGDSPEWVAQR